MIPADVVAGIRHFNSGDFFEAHESWEDHWGHGSTPEREATLGLIKVAVGFLHLRNGKRVGALTQLGWAVDLLRANASVFPELDLAAFAEEVDSVRATVRFHEDDFDDLSRRVALPRLPVPADH